jgi:hypothetical protein
MRLGGLDLARAHSRPACDSSCMPCVWQSYDPEQIRHGVKVLSTHKAGGVAVFGTGPQRHRLDKSVATMPSPQVRLRAQMPLTQPPSHYRPGPHSGVRPGGHPAWPVVHAGAKWELPLRGGVRALPRRDRQDEDAGPGGLSRTLLDGASDRLRQAHLERPQLWRQEHHQVGHQAAQDAGAPGLHCKPLVPPLVR